MHSVTGLKAAHHFTTGMCQMTDTGTKSQEKKHKQPRPIDPKISYHCNPAGEEKFTSIHVIDPITLKDPESAAQGLMQNNLTPVISDC